MKGQRMGKLLALVAMLSLASYIAYGCKVATPQPEPTSGPVSTPTKSKPEECPRLESRLYQLTLAPNPTQYAKENRIYLRNGSVRVVIELINAQSSLPETIPLQIETRSDNLVQALVPIASLCSLSNAPQVKLVRAPLEPLPLTN